MLIQLVHCHPLTESFNHALFRAARAALERGGHRVVATDLYRDGFAPAMTAAERQSYYSGAYDDAEIAELTRVLREVEGIIFCFPHWWFAMPAMMKGYFDRVWGPGIAFTHDLAGARIKPLLGHIRLFGVITSYGSPWWVTRLVAGDPGRKVLMRALKSMCGNARAFYLAHYDMDRSTPESRRRFIARVEARISRI
jgi:NAD(P)H dehydrogenase (quinone)